MSAEPYNPFNNAANMIAKQGPKNTDWHEDIVTGKHTFSNRGSKTDYTVSKNYRSGYNAGLDWVNKRNQNLSALQSANEVLAKGQEQKVQAKPSNPRSGMNQKPVQQSTPFNLTPKPYNVPKPTQQGEPVKFKGNVMLKGGKKISRNSAPRKNARKK
jgi:hypothetical protein